MPHFLILKVIFIALKTRANSLRDNFFRLNNKDLTNVRLQRASQRNKAI